MSAYLCSPEQLAAIARGFVQHVGPSLNIVVPAEVLFNDLLNENLLSIGARYPDASRISDWFDAGESLFVWEHIPEQVHTARELSELVGSYRYQSCEHDGWQTSSAYHYTEALADVLAPLAKQEEAEEAAEYARQAAAERAAFCLAHPDAGAVESAKLLKSALRDAFPATKFSVRLSRGTGYGYCDVSWTDGPTTKAVDAVVAPFEGSHFDGMTDSENYRASIMPNDPTERCTGLRSVNTHQRQSPAFVARLIAQVAAYWGFTDLPTVHVSAYDGTGTLVLLPGQDTEAHARTGHWWSDLVYQASRDATKFAR